MLGLSSTLDDEPMQRSFELFKRHLHGVEVVTFDEAENDSTACCGEGPTPNASQPGNNGPGGGRVGAVVVSKFVKAGSTNDTPYNHYALLCSIEDVFGLSHLGLAGQPGLACFGSDVYGGAKK